MAKGWTEVGSVEELKMKSLQEIMCDTTPIALTHQDGSFASISGICNHVGGRKAHQLDSEATG